VCFREKKGQLDTNFSFAPHFPLTQRNLASDIEIVCLEHIN